VLRILRVKEQLGLFDKPMQYNDPEREARELLAPAHREAARAIARQSLVLLKNDGKLLPLDPAKLRSIAVIGALATDGLSSLGSWRAQGKAEEVVTPLAGITASVPKTLKVLTAPGADPRTPDLSGIPAAVKLVKSADVTVLVIGEDYDLSGESRSRSDLELPASQLELARRVLATGKPVVVVLITGRALAVPALVEQSGALVHAFFPGIEGGHALADVLFGDYNPGGKEPVTWPRSVGQLPIHHYDPPNGRPNIPERGDYKAHWLDEPDEPLFAFGFGLSYSRFDLTSLEVPPRIGRADTLAIRVRLTNSGGVAGDEVPQLYIRPRVASTVTGKRLQAYRRVHLAGGESRVIEFKVPAQNLAVLDAQNRWVVQSGIYEVTLGTSAQGGLTGTFELAN